jgi:hypothetical protein
MLVFCSYNWLWSLFGASTKIVHSPIPNSVCLIYLLALGLDLCQRLNVRQKGIFSLRRKIYPKILHKLQSSHYSILEMNPQKESRPGLWFSVNVKPPPGPSRGSGEDDKGSCYK